MMNDLTVIYLTASLIPESFAQYQRKILLEAIEDSPYQMLRAARVLFDPLIFLIGERR